MKKQLFPSLFALLIFFSLITACQAQPTVVYVQPEERDKVAALVEPFADHILAGIAAADYQVFITDFDEGMLKAMTETQFANIVKMYGPLGTAQSRELINVEDRGSYYGANYKVTYPEKTVIMLVVLPKDDSGKVSGLWFK